jgi:intracellular multiplication protein IcmK
MDAPAPDLAMDPDVDLDLVERELERKRRQEAYQRSLEQLLPVTPEEIKDFRRQADNRDAAMADSPPRALRTRTVSLSLSPGFKPPVVELTPNLATALVFLDTSGAPWPVASTVLGSGSLYKADILKTDGDNRVILSPLSPHGNSNLIVALQGHETPLVIRLLTRSGVDSERSVDGLITFQVEGRGPKAAPPSPGARQGDPLDPALYSILDGIAPEGFKALEGDPKTEGAMFLRSGDTLYVRTRHSLLWPGFSASVSGPGGWRVFEAPLQSPVMMDVDGDVIRISLKGKEEG